MVIYGYGYICIKKETEIVQPRDQLKFAVSRSIYIKLYKKHLFFKQKMLSFSLYLHLLIHIYIIPGILF